jgi:hypothetical protein
MSLREAADLGQVIAAIAVLGSLVFVGLQVRQNTQFQKRSVVDALSTAIACITVKGIESPALGDALAAALQDWGAASREQRIIAHYFLFSYFKLSENAWYQRQAGVLEPAQWVGWETMVRHYYHSAGVRDAWWPRRREAFSEAFQTYLAGTAAPPAYGSLSDIFADPPREAASERPLLVFAVEPEPVA